MHITILSGQFSMLRINERPYSRRSSVRGGEKGGGWFPGGRVLEMWAATVEAANVDERFLKSLISSAGQQPGSPAAY